MYGDSKRVCVWCFLRLCVLAGLLGGQSAQAGATWEGGSGSADVACRAKIDESGAYAYSRVEVKGDVGHCYVKAKEGKGEDIYTTAVTRDNPPETEQPSKDASAKNEGDAKDSEKTCAEAHKGVTECYLYEGRGMTLKSYEDTRKILVNLNSGQKLDRKQAPADLCDTSGEHWNFHAKGKFKGSVLGCECCRNTDTGPALEKRYRAFPN